MKKTLFSIVIPIYFNEKNIPLTYPRLTKLAENISKSNFEFIFIDDGSQDKSLQELIKLKKKDRRIKIIKLTRNFGSFNAILAGLKYTKGDCVGVISADLQDPPELFIRMFNLWKKGAKTIMAVRSDRDDPYLSKLASNLYYWLLRKYAIPAMPKGGFDFVLIDKQVVESIRKIEEKNTSLMALIAWLGFNREIVYYVRKKREIGTSKWNFSKKFKLFVDSFTAFSYMPIRMITIVGFIIALLSFLYALLVIYLKFFHKTDVQGWTSLTVIVLFLSGFQLAALGIIGEYLWRNFDESRKRPNYVIDKIFN